MKKISTFVIGVLCSTITLIAVSTQPVISKARPQDLDPLFYAICTVLFEALLVLPIMIPESIRFKKNMMQLKMENPESLDDINKSGDYRLFQFRKTWWRFLIIGSVFALAQYLFFYGFDISDAISGSIALKSSIIFTIFSGWIFLKEKASAIQVFFTILIMVALMYTLTEGSFNALRINIGTVILILVPLLWTIGHTLTKPMLKKKYVIPSQVIFLRTSVSTIILCAIYFSFYPSSQLGLFLNLKNIISILLISGSYLIGHYFWYMSISKIELALSSATQAPQPILTSILAGIFLGTHITYYQIIGLIAIVSSILIILYDKNRLAKKLDRKTKKND